MTFIERYRSAVGERQTRLCIGLDSDTSWLPESLSAEPNRQLAFNRAIIDQTSDLCIAYKPNLAFYESQGSVGLDALEQTLDAVPEGVFTIGDAKRGDIGNTAMHYARSLFEVWGFDSVTVNPYMGTDTIEPYFEHWSRCVFVLALTSNPGSRDFQHISEDGRPLHEIVISRCLERFGDSDQLGFVVGATHPDELARIRSIVGPDIPLLIPGIGAQGGDIDGTVLANDGGAAFINVSRGIIKAGTGEDFADEARKAAISYRQMLAARDPELREGATAGAGD